MKSHEAIKQLVAGRAKVFGDRIARSSSMVHKWTEESHYTDDPQCVVPSGARNHLDVIEQMMEIGIALGVEREDYMAPVAYLEERFGRVGIDLPAKMPEPRDLMPELTAAIKEFGDLMKVSSEAVESEGVDRRENERIQREGWQVLRQTVMVMKLAEMQAGRKK